VRRRSLRRSKKGGAPSGRRDRVEVRRLPVAYGNGIWEEAQEGCAAVVGRKRIRVRVKRVVYILEV
jgi:hypothetical protein